MAGWIKLHRTLLDWEWYDDTNTKVLFIHLLLKANHEEKKWKGETIQRGEFITGLNSLSSDLKMSMQNIRTSLAKLEKTGEINKQSNSRFTKITICKYDDYNDKDVKGNKPANNPTPPPKKGEASSPECEEIPILTFDEFWDLYDKKVGDKKKLQKKFDALPAEALQKILDHVPSYKMAQPDKQFRKDPGTYINNQSWNDEIIMKNGTSRATNQEGTSWNELAEILETEFSAK